MLIDTPTKRRPASTVAAPPSIVTKPLHERISSALIGPPRALQSRTFTGLRRNRYSGMAVIGGRSQSPISRTSRKKRSLP
jgi:hypothetical protein